MTTAPAMYLFTCTTDVRTARREHYGHRGPVLRLRSRHRLRP